MRAMLIVLAAVVAGLLAGTSAAAGVAVVVEGPAVVIDGDTLRIDGGKVRLFGIDAPERQTRLGPLATAMLDELLAGRSVSCSLVGNGFYREDVGRCAVAAGPDDLGLAMVRAGWAAADRRFTKEYDDAEREARAARRGLWADLPVGERERDFWEWVEVFQTGLGALFGLFGLALAVWLNGWSTRRRDDRLHNRDAKALASALSAEMFVLISTVHSARIFFQEKYDAGVVVDPILVKTSMTVPPEIYRRHIDSLTLLPPVTAHLVVAFYISLGAFNEACEMTCRSKDPQMVTLSAVEKLTSISTQTMSFGNKARGVLFDFIADRPLPIFTPGDIEDAPAPEPEAAPADDDSAT